MSAPSSRDVNLNSVPSACGTRSASACAPPTSPVPKNPPCTHAVCRPSWQNAQVPSGYANGITTTSPRFSVRTSAPTSSTTPMASCPIGCGSLSRSFNLYGHKSLPQIQARVMRISASVGCLIAASGTLSIRTSPA